MKTAMLINDKGSRSELAGIVASQGVAADEYPTAAKALGMFSATRYDLIVIHWKVYPGLKPSDPEIQELAAMIPVSRMNRNALYWETALRVIDIIRTAGLPNESTPLIVIFPDLGRTDFGAGDRLTSEAVHADLAKRQPATIVSGILREKESRAG